MTNRDLLRQQFRSSYAKGTPLSASARSNLWTTFLIPSYPSYPASYTELKSEWQRILTTPTHPFHEYLSDTYATIQKDVIRQDRNHPFFSTPTTSDPEFHNNINLRYLQTITMTLMYSEMLSAIPRQQRIGYGQGMLDLLVPILFVFKDDSDMEEKSYWAFKTILRDERVESLFMASGRGMQRLNQTVHKLLALLDVELSNYLDSLGAPFVGLYRWVVLLFKREYENWEDILGVWDHWITLEEGVLAGVVYTVIGVLVASKGVVLEKHRTMDEWLVLCQTLVRSKFKPEELVEWMLKTRNWFKGVVERYGMVDEHKYLQLRVTELEDVVDYVWMASRPVSAKLSFWNELSEEVMKAVQGC